MPFLFRLVQAFFLPILNHKGNKSRGEFSCIVFSFANIRIFARTQIYYILPNSA